MRKVGNQVSKPKFGLKYKLKLGKIENIETKGVVYFDQRLGAAHSKRWSKQSFTAFLLQNPKKGRNLQQILAKTGFFTCGTQVL